MAKTKRASNKKQTLHFSPVYLLIVALLALCIALGAALAQQTDTIGKYELLEKIDNQACRYLAYQSQSGGINGSFDLNLSARDNEPLLVYKCTNGQVTTDREIHGKGIGEYELGAIVMYFATNEAAERYAEENINPLRYWGVDEEGQQNGIPQTSAFTFIVTDEPVPYFDAYTVKANAVLRVSLPCPKAETHGVTDCYDEANSILKSELKGINVL
jgi:hypothetical protein